MASEIYSFVIVIYKLIFPYPTNPWVDTIPSEGLLPKILESRIAYAVKGGVRTTIIDSLNSQLSVLRRDVGSKNRKINPAEQLKVLIGKLQVCFDLCLFKILTQVIRFIIFYFLIDRRILMKTRPEPVSSLNLEALPPYKSTIQSKNNNVAEHVGQAEVKNKISLIEIVIYELQLANR